MSQQPTENLELLLEVGRLLSSKLDLKDLLRTIMEFAARVVNAETASLLMVDERTNELYFDVALGLDPALTKLRLKMGQGIAGSVAQDCKPLIINDVRKDPRWSSKMDDDSGFVTRSILAAPMLLKGRRIGVVEAINRAGGDFTITDLRIFEAFASQCAVAVDNARLFASLREERAKLDTLFSEMSDAAVLADGGGAILLANRAAQRLLGMEGAVPRSLPEEASEFAFSPPLAEMLASPETALSFEAVRGKPKKLVLEGTANLISTGPAGEAAGGRVFVFRDVTEAKVEEGLKRNFLSLISHKLKTPLSSITGYSQLLSDEFASKGAPDLHKKAVQTVHSQGQKLIVLVEKLLNYTVLEGLEAAELTRAEFKVDEILEEAVHQLEPWLHENNGRAAVTASSGLVARGDAILIRDAVKNIIENAVKFDTRHEARRVAVWAAQGQGGRTEIRIKDSGPGIPPEEQERIFQKFYQIETSFTGQVEGWGLGLSFVQKVALKHGGSVRVESRLGQGTTFIVSLPAAEASA